MFEISRTVVSMSTAGVLVIVAGIVARRHGLTRGSLPDRAIALGRVFVAAPLATFGALHLAAANGLMGMVPTYMPWPLFWVYFVGFGLIATALSLIFDRFVRWSGLLCGVMFLLFVAMMDIPAVAAGSTIDLRLRWLRAKRFSVADCWRLPAAQVRKAHA